MLFWTWCVVFTMGEKYILWYTFLLFMLNIQKYNFLPAQKRCLQHEEWDWCETADCCHSSEAVKNTCDDSVISAARFTLRFNFRAVAPGEPESLSLSMDFSLTLVCLQKLLKCFCRANFL